MTSRMLARLVATLAAAPLVASAQQPTRPMQAMPMQHQSSMPCDMHAMMMGPMMGGRMGGMMGGKMTDSSMMMQMQSQLGLSDAQMQQMRTMHQRACAAAEPHMQMAMQARQAAMQELHGDHPNLDAYKAQLDKAASQMVQAQMELGKAMIEFHNTLTPAQRQKMEQMHQRMMHGG